MTANDIAPPRPRTVRPQTVRYDGAQNRLRVLDAALDVFSQVGYEGASTRAIAAAAGIEQGHLAYYFPNKMALWRQVIETFAQQAEQRLAHHIALSEGAPACAIARAALPVLLRGFAENPRLTRLMLQEMSVSSDRSTWLAENFAQPVWRLLAPVFSQMRADGYLGGTAPEIAYFSLIGAALITFGNRALIAQFSGIDPADEHWVEEAIAHMLAPVFTSTGPAK
ncbi:TetR/AcrR family transcriptional regulator [Novosphingobium umbonatum]|nr:TetR/AcrR family transcriptional regulator [Novosphingobium umbonatum]